LFNGEGASRPDVAALERILGDRHLGYATADSRQLNSMSEDVLRSYRLLIVPGGNFETLGNGLTASTTQHIRHAVQGGLGYLGICAGAFMAGNSPYNGLNLTRGVRFHFYSAESRGIRKALVPIDIAGEPAPLEQYWEDGPVLTGWGDVVATYPDGTAAVVEGSAGAGWVILTGVHPEAPESWRRGMGFRTPASTNHDYAATLINAALSRTSLAHF